MTAPTGSTTQQRRTPPVAAAAPLVAPAPAAGLVGHAEALQSILSDVSTLTVSQIVQLFRQYGDQPDFPATLYAAFPEIVHPHAEAAAQITAQWFNDIVPDANAQPVVDLPPERLTKTLDWALHAPTKTEAAVPADETRPAVPADETKSPPTPDETVSRLAGSTKRMVFDASRQTVLANARIQGLRWARQAQPDACAFCRLLATRSDEQLYKSEGVKFDKELDDYITVVVGRGGKPRGSRNIGDKYHDHCRCVAVPIPQGGTYEPPGYVAQWQEDYEKARNDVSNSGDVMNVKNILSQMRAHTDAR